MSIISTTKMTSRQFLELGEDPPGIHLELVNGEIALSPSATPLHSHIVLGLGSILLEFIKQQGLGHVYYDVNTIFGEHDVLRPDLIYFQKSRLHLVGEKALEGPPDLCVEVLSPSSVVIDRKDKFKQYQKGGVNFYWIVDPKANTIEAFKLSRGKYVSAGKGKGAEVVKLPPFEELRIPLMELWADGSKNARP